MKTEEVQKRQHAGARNVYKILIEKVLGKETRNRVDKKWK
jgi:hypothetical protein